MAARRGSTSALKSGAKAQQEPPSPTPHQIEVEDAKESTAAESISATSESANGATDNNSATGLSEEDDRTSVSASATSVSGATTSSAGGSSSGSEKGIKPSESELVQDTERLKEESSDLKLSLVEEKLALIDKRLVNIEQGKDEDFDQQLEEARKTQERKMTVAKERLRLSRESALEEYSASIDQIQDELKGAKLELMLSRELKHRVKAEHHTSSRMEHRQHAGHEFPLHVEYQITSSQVAEDLQRISSAAVPLPKSPPLPPAPAIPSVHSPPRKESSRKHSLKEVLMEDASGSGGRLQVEDNHMSKVRRKSK